MWVKIVSDLKISGCKLHRNAFGGRALPGPYAEAIAHPQTSSRYKREGREGRGRKWLGIEMGRKEREGNDVNG